MTDEQKAIEELNAIRDRMEAGWHDCFWLMGFAVAFIAASFVCIFLKGALADFLWGVTFVVGIVLQFKADRVASRTRRTFADEMTDFERRYGLR